MHPSVDVASDHAHHSTNLSNRSWAIALCCVVGLICQQVSAIVIQVAHTSLWTEDSAEDGDGNVDNSAAAWRLMSLC
eukprot:1226513-Amphidinium_carterae.1